MKTKAQAIIEYAILAGIIAAALVAMQVYFKRGIQGVVKLASDELGDQQRGLVDIDFELQWLQIGDSIIRSASGGQKTANTAQGGRTAYGKDEGTAQQGILSYNLYGPQE